MKYRKKPVVIDAVQWTGKNLREVVSFMGHNNFNRETFSLRESDEWEKYVAIVEREGFKISTLEGEMLANISDWIIKGVNGEFYPCKPDIFEKTYEDAATAPTPQEGNIPGWVWGSTKPIYAFNENDLHGMITDFLNDYLKDNGYSGGSESDSDRMMDELNKRKNAALSILENGTPPQEGRQEAREEKAEAQDTEGQKEDAGKK